MTSLTPFASGDGDDALVAVDQPGATLASLVDHLMEAASPVAFQVVFQRRASWQSDAEVRKEDLVDGRDTFFQEVVGSFLEVEDQRSDHDEKQLSESVENALSISTRRIPSGRSLLTSEQSAFRQGLRLATNSRPRWTHFALCSTQWTGPITKSKENDSGQTVFVKRRRRRTPRQPSDS